MSVDVCIPGDGARSSIILPLHLSIWLELLSTDARMLWRVVSLYCEAVLTSRETEDTRPHCKHRQPPDYRGMNQTWKDG